MSDAKVVVIEVPRRGRRPRYHRGALIGLGVTTSPEACNLDQVLLRAGVRLLDRLPPLRRPLTQLCRRCWRGTPELETAQNPATEAPGEEMPT